MRAVQWVIGGNWKVSGLGSQRRRCVRWTEEAEDLMVMRECNASPEQILLTMMNIFLSLLNTCLAKNVTREGVC